ncbi:DUF3768 domain-containing protein [Mesorhizobium sp. A623]
MATNDAVAIRNLNDILRTTGAGGTTVFVGALGQAPESERMAVYSAAREFDSFPEGDDPYGEHDFGTLMLDGKKYTWKIDYYDKAMEFGSDNPADPSVTNRVLSIFYADDY